MKYRDTYRIVTQVSRYVSHRDFRYRATPTFYRLPVITCVPSSASPLLGAGSTAYRSPGSRTANQRRSSTSLRRIPSPPARVHQKYGTSRRLIFAKTNRNVQFSFCAHRKIPRTLRLEVGAWRLHVALESVPLCYVAPCFSNFSIYQLQF